MSIKQDIVTSVSGQKNDHTLYVLIGFNFWIQDIIDALGSGSPFLTTPSAVHDIEPNFPLLNQSLNSGLPIYVSMETYSLLVEKSLAGVPQMYGYKIVFIKNDLFETYYPDTPVISEVHAKQEMYQSDTDNHIQKYYSDYQVRDNVGYYTYNLDTGEETTLIPITSLLNIEPLEAYSDNSETIYIPEEFDNITSSQLVLNIIASDIRVALVTEEVSQKGQVKRLLATFSKIGLKIQYRQYQAPEVIIDQQRVLSYRDILRRKNPTYDFFDIQVYDDPYESTSLSNINQLQIIESIVSNSINAQQGDAFRDIFVTAPTGAGKSVMFQVPAIYLAESYGLLTIIVSPLIGLMNDQVENIKMMTEAAATINSDYTPIEKEETLERVKNGEVSLLYLSPESLLSNTDITNLIGDRKIGLLVVDEAHIVATWGKSFRPDYWYLGEFIQRLRNSKHSEHRFPIATFTATATFGGEDNMYQEIVDSLSMTPVKFIGNVKRSDIEFNIHHRVKSVAYKEEKLGQAVASINALHDTNEKTLVYTPYTKHIHDIYQNLKIQETTGRYYGGMSAADKTETLLDIKSGKKNLVLATKAFGMGIDINDIKYVYHFAPTGNIPDYVQEIGRAARRQDMTGVAVTDFYKEDFRYVNQLYGMSSIKNYQVVAVLQKIYDLFNKYKKRNFLVAPDEFSYIFADCRPEDVDARLKTTLLIIKKDFEINSRNTFIPLIFKPRGLFTQGYFTINDDFLGELKSKGLLRYFEKQHLPRTIKSADRSGSPVSVRQPGDTYKINFKELWEDRYKDISFGMFKKSFFDNTLPGFDYKVGNKLLARIIIQIDASGGNIGTVRSSLIDFLNSLQGVFDDFKQEGKHVSVDQISAAIVSKTTVSKRSVATMLGATIFELLHRVDNNSLTNTYGFSSYNSATGKYVVRNGSYERSIRTLKNCAKAMLSNTEDTKAVRYTQNKIGSNEVIVAQLIEQLELADVKIASGQNPEFFIRVNSPSAIEKILNNKKYLSRTVYSVGEKHKESSQLMEYFFTALETDKERWDFIEKYFLGLLRSDMTNNNDSD